MDAYVINPDRGTDRWQAFQAANGNPARVIRRRAVDGMTLVRDEFARRGLISADPGMSDAAIGVALSHLGLWELVLERNAPLTICEDDAIFNRNFFALSEDLAASLPADWDIVLWGWNFNSILAFELLPGVSSCIGKFSQDALRKGVASFQAADVRPDTFRLHHGFGTVCYSLSPKGARALRAFCLPIRAMEVDVAGLAPKIANTDIGITMNALYRDINAFVCFPPIAATVNDHTASTVRA